MWEKNKCDTKEKDTAALERAFLSALEKGAEEDTGQQYPFEIEKDGENIGQRGKQMQKLALWTLVLLMGATVCLGYPTFVLIDWYGSEVRSENKMEELRELGRLDSEGRADIGSENQEKLGAEEVAEDGTDDTVTNTVSQNTNTMEETAAEINIQSASSEILAQYAPVFARNEDMVAWLTIEDTKIDYPVMQTPEDENYYLYRDFYGESDKAGCLILDNGSDLYGRGSTNQIIHGHHMKSGTMFGELDKYQEEEYGREHSRIQLITKEEVREYEVVAVFYSKVYLTTDITFKYYNFFRADTEEEFQYFYENIKELSLYDTGVEAELGERFLTLSTCAYHTEDGRFVVVAKEVE